MRRWKWPLESRNPGPCVTEISFPPRMLAVALGILCFALGRIPGRWNLGQRHRERAPPLSPCPPLPSVPPTSSQVLQDVVRVIEGWSVEKGHCAFLVSSTPNSNNQLDFFSRDFLSSECAHLNKREGEREIKGAQSREERELLLFFSGPFLHQESFNEYAIFFSIPARHTATPSQSFKLKTFRSPSPPSHTQAAVEALSPLLLSSKRLWRLLSRPRAV